MSVLRRLLLIHALLAVSLVAQAQSPAASPPSAPQADEATAAELAHQDELDALREQDRQLREKLAARLAVIPGLEQVRVEVTGGVVRLRGEAADDARRRLATTLAEQADGVVHVDNQVSIDTALSTRTAPLFAEARERLGQLLAAVPLFAVALLIVWGSLLLGRWLARRPRLLRATRRNPFLDNLSRQIVQLVVLGVGIVIALDLLNATALVGALLGTVGIIGIAVGFAFRDVVENYIAGILLSLRQPFAPHDHVVIDGHEGKVAALTSRATILITLDGNHLRIPNAQVFKGVTLNYSRNPTRRFSFEVGIGNAESVSRAQRIAVETLSGIEGILHDPPPAAPVANLGDSSTILRVGAWVDQRQTSFGRARSEAIRLVRRAFIVHGVDTPDPGYRVVLTQDGGTSTGAGTDASTSTMEHEAEAQADLSPEQHLERTIDQERTARAGDDLLDPNARPE